MAPHIYTIAYLSATSNFLHVIINIALLDFTITLSVFVSLLPKMGIIKYVRIDHYNEVDHTPNS